MNYYRCSDFHCIPKWKVCDGVKDCSSDEQGCDYTVVSGCTKDQFKCQNKQCISGHLVCDGYDGCGDASDELFCCE